MNCSTKAWRQWSSAIYMPTPIRPMNSARARCWSAFGPIRNIVLGSEVLPEFREFERTSTAVASAYVQPLIDRYLRSWPSSYEPRATSATFC